MLLKVDCLPNAVGKQPSIPLIYLGRKLTLNWSWWWWWWCLRESPNNNNIYNVEIEIEFVVRFFQWCRFGHRRIDSIEQEWLGLGKTCVYQEIQQNSRLHTGEPVNFVLFTYLTCWYKTDAILSRK